MDLRNYSQARLNAQKCRMTYIRHSFRITAALKIWSRRANEAIYHEYRIDINTTLNNYLKKKSNLASLLLGELKKDDDDDENLTLLSSYISTWRFASRNL